MDNIINDLLIGLNSIGKIFFNYASALFIQTAVLVIVIFIVDVLFLRKRVRAIFRYCIWLLVLIKLVLPPTLSLPTSISYWMPDNLSVSLPVPDRTYEIVEMEGIGEYSVSPQTLTSEDMFENSPITVEAEQGVISITWQAVIFILWLCGVLAFLLVLAQRLKFVRGLVVNSKPASDKLLNLLENCRLQMNLRQKVRLRLSEAVSSPAVCGLFTPVVLIPENLVNSLSIEGLRSTLIHELAHIKRFDLWINFFQTVLQVVYFYNPFVWFTNSAIRKVCEEAVDETVLVNLGGKAEDYSDVLINIGQAALWKSDLGLRLIGVAESKKALQWRIKHMLNRPIPKSAKIGVLGTIALLIIAVVLLPMARAERSNENINSDSVSEAQAVGEEKHYDSLIEAVRAGNLKEVQRFIDEGADLNATRATPSRNTLLHLAVIHDNKEIVELLINNGADINIKNLAGQTPFDIAQQMARVRGQTEILNLIKSKTEISSIHLAARFGDLEKVQAFLKQGIDINSKDKNGDTALHIALDHDFNNIVEFLVNHGADVNATGHNNLTPLYISINHMNKDMIKLLLNKGADVYITKHIRGLGSSLLYDAIQTDDLDIISLLLDHGAKLDVKDETGWTDLHYAAEGGMRSSRNIVEFFISKVVDKSNLYMSAFTGDLTRVKELIDQGIGVDNKDEAGWTALFWASCGGQTDVAEFLINKGADVNFKISIPGVGMESRGRVPDPDGTTPLHQAAKIGELSLVELLVSKGADIDAIAIGIYTPLGFAALGGHLQVVEFLVSKGANVNATNQNGLTPLLMVCQSGSKEVVEFLIDNGADIQAKGGRGRTPLHIACLRGNKEIVELLIDKGTDVNVKDNRGQTPLSLVEQRGQTEIVELLKKHGAK